MKKMVHCFISVLFFFSLQDTHLLEFSVPMGRESDMRVVVFGTIVVTVMGCTVLLYIIAFYDQWKMKVKER